MTWPDDDVKNRRLCRICGQLKDDLDFTDRCYDCEQDQRFDGGFRD